MKKSALKPLQTFAFRLTLANLRSLRAKYRDEPHETTEAALTNFEAHGCSALWRDGAYTVTAPTHALNWLFQEAEGDTRLLKKLAKQLDPAWLARVVADFLRAAMCSDAGAPSYVFADVPLENPLRRDCGGDADALVDALRFRGDLVCGDAEGKMIERFQRRYPATMETITDALS